MWSVKSKCPERKSGADWSHDCYSDHQLQLQQYNSKKGFITNKDELYLNIGDSIGEDGKAGHYV